MVGNGGSASGKPAEKEQVQENFKLRMERDAYKAQYVAVVRKNEKLSAANAELQLSQDHKALLLQNAIELIKKFQLELYVLASQFFDTRS